VLASQKDYYTIPLSIFLLNLMNYVLSRRKINQGWCRKLVCN